MSNGLASLPAIKVEPMRKSVTGTASFHDGVGAVFLEKWNHNEGLRIEMMFSWVMMVSEMYIIATTCNLLEWSCGNVLIYTACFGVCILCLSVLEP